MERLCPFDNKPCTGSGPAQSYGECRQGCELLLKEKVVDKVPVIWGYAFDDVIGGAIIEEDGTVTFTITDPRIIELVKKDRKIEAVSLYNTPAIRKE